MEYRHRRKELLCYLMQVHHVKVATVTFWLHNDKSEESGDSDSLDLIAASKRPKNILNSETSPSIRILRNEDYTTLELIQIKDKVMNMIVVFVCVRVHV